MYYCVGCNNEIELPDYPEDGNKEILICPRVECGKRAVVVDWMEQP